MQLNDIFSYQMKHIYMNYIQFMNVQINTSGNPADVKGS